MPNPPTPEELEGWEKLSSKLFAGEYAMAELEELCLGVDALLAEVKRLREENAKDVGTCCAGGEATAGLTQVERMNAEANLSSGCDPTVAGWAGVALRLDAHIAELWEVLRFARHRGTCSQMLRSGSACDCGIDMLRAKYRAVPTPKASTNPLPDSSQGLHATDHVTRSTPRL